MVCRNEAKTAMTGEEASDVERRRGSLFRLSLVG